VRAGTDQAPPTLFGFIVHPLTRLHLAVYRAWRLGRGAGVLKRYTPLRTRPGAHLAGLVYGVPLLPLELVEDQERAVAAIRRGVEDLAEAGAAAVGLGALCAVVGARGRAVADGAPVPVTTGHEITAWAAARTLERVGALVGAAADEPAVVLGAPAAVAVAVARLLAEAGRPVLLAARGSRGPLARVVARTDGLEAIPDDGAPGRARLVVSASSGGGVLTESELSAGTVLVDVARPRDLAGPRRRQDVLVVDGEMVSLPGGTAVDPITRAYNHVVGQAVDEVFACFAAPMLAAAGAVERALSPGRFLAPDDVRAWGEAAERHGFFVHRLYDRGRPLSEARLAAFCAAR